MENTATVSLKMLSVSVQYFGLLETLVPLGIWNSLIKPNLRHQRDYERMKMGFRKFGTPEERSVELDDEKEETLRRTSSTKWTDEDRKALDEENSKK